MAHQTKTGPRFGTFDLDTRNSDTMRGTGQYGQVYSVDHLTYQAYRPSNGTAYVETDKGFYGDGSKASETDDVPTVDDPDIGTPVTAPESMRFVVKRGFNPITIEETVLDGLKSKEMKEFVIYMPAPYTPDQVMEQLISVDKYVQKEQNSIDLVEFFTAYAEWTLAVCEVAAKNNLMLSDFKPANVACHNLGPHDWAFRLIDLDGISTFEKYNYGQTSAIKFHLVRQPTANMKFEINKYAALFNSIYSILKLMKKESQERIIYALLNVFEVGIENEPLNAIISKKDSTIDSTFVAIIEKVCQEKLSKTWEFQPFGKQVFLVEQNPAAPKRIQNDATVPETKS